MGHRWSTIAQLGELGMRMRGPRHKQKLYKIFINNKIVVNPKTGTETYLFLAKPKWLSIQN